MAHDERTTPPALNGLRVAAYEYDFFQALRRLECAFPDHPRWGTALRPADEPVRLGQEATLAITAGSVARFDDATETEPARLIAHCFGMLGPNGALPLHLTDYALQRTHQHHDPTFARFLDMFHHRMLALFYRAWSSAQPSVQRDRPQADRFVTYLGALFGAGTPSLRGREPISDNTKLYYAGLFVAHTRNASGLAALVGDYFQIGARVTEFVGEWVALPRQQAWHLGRRGRPGSLVLGALGSTALVGTRVWMRQHRFRLVLGPLSREQFALWVDGKGQAGHMPRLRALVRSYVGDELKWDVQLVLKREAVRPAQLGRTAHLGRTAWLIAQAGRAGWDNLVVDPMHELDQPPSAARVDTHTQGAAHV